MNVKIKSPFKPDKVARFLGQEGDLAKLQAIAAFSMPGINLQPGDKFCTPIEDVIFPESVEHEQMAEGTRIALCNDLSALRSENARLREACQSVMAYVEITGWGDLALCANADQEKDNLGEIAVIKVRAALAERGEA